MIYFETFFRAFIPLFVAVNAIGILPLYMNLTEELPIQEKAVLVKNATLTAFAVGITFLTCGKLVFIFLGISEDDFRIAGGIVLLVISVSDLLFSTLQKRRQPGSDVGVVPIGIPLMVGPAALTTLLILNDTYGFLYAASALLINLIIVWFIFHKSDLLVKVIGVTGSRAIGKIMALFLGAIAVMMIRVGLTNFLS